MASLVCSHLAWAESTTRVAYARFSNGPGQIWVMDDDGSNKTQLTNPGSGGTDEFPSISPSARKVYFQRTTSGQTDIWVINNNGTGATNLTNSSGYNDTHPDAGRYGYSSHVLFASDRDDSLGEIYKMNLDGSNVVRLTDNDQEDLDPAWCGSKVVLARRDSSSEGSDLEIWIRDLSPGGTETKLTDNDDEDRSPSCNVTGTYVAFSRDGFPYSLTDIFTKNLSTGVEENLTEEFMDYYGIYVNDYHPSWSPGGTRIAFTVQDASSGSWDVYSLEVPEPGFDTEEPLALANTSAAELEPDYGELSQ